MQNIKQVQTQLAAHKRTIKQTVALCAGLLEIHASLMHTRTCIAPSCLRMTCMHCVMHCVALIATVPNLYIAQTTCQCCSLDQEG